MIDLKHERENKGMTQQELADKCHVIRQTISNIECGLALPSIGTAKAIGQVLGFNWSNFFDD